MSAGYTSRLALSNKKSSSHSMASQSIHEGARTGLDTFTQTDLGCCDCDYHHCVSFCWDTNGLLRRRRRRVDQLHVPLINGAACRTQLSHHLLRSAHAAT